MLMLHPFAKVHGELTTHHFQAVEIHHFQAHTIHFIKDIVENIL